MEKKKYLYEIVLTKSNGTQEQETEWGTLDQAFQRLITLTEDVYKNGENKRFGVNIIDIYKVNYDGEEQNECELLFSVMINKRF